MKINLFWFRRDLRLEDNTALNEALAAKLPVLPVFIFDTSITDELAPGDPRITFIYESLSVINNELRKKGSSVYVCKGDTEEVFKKLIIEFDINCVYINKDYEPYAIQRDNAIETLLNKSNAELKKYKDQVIFEEKEILKPDNNPYTIFTPYKKRWLRKLSEQLPLINYKTQQSGENYYQHIFEFPSLEKNGFLLSPVKVRPYDLNAVKEYDKYRDQPFADRTSYLSPHLRFGTVSIRKLVRLALDENTVFLNELIWREFFMHILFCFPQVVTGNFKSKYDEIKWMNREDDFLKWCRGETGYPMVDAGMRQLNTTGYMHNRVRMITAGFLCKHLLIDWRWGEAYFAGKLLDFELSSNNGNWQWAAATGCDAAPWFRIFSPDAQQKKFDPKKEYIRKWVKDFDESSYPKPMIDHDFARKRAIEAYKSGISSLK